VIRLPLIDGPWETPVELPDGRATLLDLLPAARQVADRTTADAAARAGAAGKAISCRAGCAACCREMISVSLVEAVALADLVAALPPERQAVVRGRFAENVRRLEAAGLLDPAEPPGTRALIPRRATTPAEARADLVGRYHALGLACPFLDDESCSVYAERPIICREYQVTSPAERCARPPGGGPIESATPDVRVGTALTVAGHRTAGLIPNLVPMVLALEWAESVGAAVRRARDGADLAKAFAEGVREQTEPPPTMAGPGEVTGNLQLRIGNRRVELSVTVPAGPTSPRALLPLARGLTEVAVESAVDQARADGKEVSCKAGCGACCRQVVPLAPDEARHLARLVEELPGPRGEVVRGRFGDALRRLRLAGLVDRLREPPAAGDDRRQLGRDYFALQVACPFLEDESCSIHPERPLACREYLVSSPAGRCADPLGGGVERLPLPVVAPVGAFAQAAAGLGPGEAAPWVPLVTALEWAAANPEPVPRRTGPELAQLIVGRMTRGSEVGRGG
jgi:Fe-S-cluster containining protein